MRSFESEDNQIMFCVIEKVKLLEKCKVRADTVKMTNLKEAFWKEGQRNNLVASSPKAQVSQVTGSRSYRSAFH